MTDEFVVNGLPLPPLLISLIQQDKWKHPGDIKMREIIPFLVDPVIFCSLKQIHSETNAGYEISNPPNMSQLFRIIQGSKLLTSVDMPWLDVEKIVFIGVNAAPGDDVAIALDYRTNISDPRVVASDWQLEGCFWREVTPTFTEFVERLGLK